MYIQKRMRKTLYKNVFKNLKYIFLIARFLALVTTMVTKVDHGNYSWLPRLVTMVSYLGYQGANHGY